MAGCAAVGHIDPHWPEPGHLSWPYVGFPALRQAARDASLWYPGACRLSIEAAAQRLPGPTGTAPPGR